MMTGKPMSYSAQDIVDLKNRIDAALSDGRLNTWETSFLSDIKARIERYGTRTRFGEKQEQKIREIIGGYMRWSHFVGQPGGLVKVYSGA